MSPIDFTPIARDYPSPGDDPVLSPWYIYVGVVLESTGDCDYIAALWAFLVESFEGHDKQLRVARRLREGLLKTSVLVGFPKGINALASLRSAINEQNPELGKILEADKSIRASIPAAQLNQRGYEFYEAVYGKVAEKVKENMAKSSGGDLSEFAVLSVYGELMAETSIVDAKETGLLEFVACYVTGAVPQANGHMHGSHNLGNSKEEIQAAIQLVRSTMALLDLPFDDSKMTFTEKMNKW